MPFPFPFTMFGANRQSAGLENTYSMEFGDADAGSAPGNSTSTAHYATGGNILDKTGGEGFTISAWIKWNATSGGSSLNSILSKRQGGGTYKGYYFYVWQNIENVRFLFKLSQRLCGRCITRVTK